MSKAKFRGECQVCGATQKAQGSWETGFALAKHGYTTRWGFFSGVCSGAHGQPWEVACDLVEAAVTGAQAQVEKLEALIAEARQPITGSLVWVNVYVPSTWARRKSYRVWRQVELIDGRYYADENGHNTHNGVKVSQLGYYGEDAAQQSHKSRARDLGRQVAQLQEYITWQTARLSSWAPKALVPVKGSVAA